MAIKAMAAKLRIVAARLWQLFLVIVITECARDTEKATKPYFTFPLSLVVATWRINFENDAPCPAVFSFDQRSSWNFTEVGSSGSTRPRPGRYFTENRN